MFPLDCPPHRCEVEKFPCRSPPHSPQVRRSLVGLHHGQFAPGKEKTQIVSSPINFRENASAGMVGLNVATPVNFHVAESTFGSFLCVAKALVHIWVFPLHNKSLVQSIYAC